MLGSRPLTEKEIQDILNNITGIHAIRDKCLFMLGLKTGFRISELLSIKIGDIYQHGMVTDTVTVQRKNMKGKTNGRTVPLHPEAKNHLYQLVSELKKLGYESKDNYLFQSQKPTNHPINRQRAQKIFEKAFQLCKITGKVSTHSMRKTFAATMFDRLEGNIFKIQKALGHANINNTVKYLSFKQEEIDEAILS